LPSSGVTPAARRQTTCGDPRASPPRRSLVREPARHPPTGVVVACWRRGGIAATRGPNGVALIRGHSGGAPAAVGGDPRASPPRRTVVREPARHPPTGVLDACWWRGGIVESSRASRVDPIRALAALSCRRRYNQPVGCCCVYAVISHIPHYTPTCLLVLLIFFRASSWALLASSRRSVRKAVWRGRYVRSLAITQPLGHTCAHAVFLTSSCACCLAPFTAW